MVRHESLVIDQKILNNGKTIRLVCGDITGRNVDFIVNPANSYLKHGGGVAAAIVRKGGQVIQEESDKIGYVPVGTAVITTSGKLPWKAVIHTVGPTSTRTGNWIQKYFYSCDQHGYLWFS